MQAGRNAAASTKETVKNAVASAKAGMEKTKATLQEKGERMTTTDPMKKEMATEKKEERVRRAEMEKRDAKAQHAAEKEAIRASAGGGVAGHPTGLSAVPGQHHRTTTGAPMGIESAGLAAGTGAVAPDTHGPNHWVRDGEFL